MAGHRFQWAGRAWETTHADSAPHRAEPPKCIAKTNGAMGNPMAPIDNHNGNCAGRKPDGATVSKTARIHWEPLGQKPIAPESPVLVFPERQ